jgi:hypothetical protein
LDCNSLNFIIVDVCHPDRDPSLALYKRVEWRDPLTITNYHL